MVGYAVVLKSLFILFALIGVGFVCGRFRVVSEHASKDITSFVMKVSLPCLLFRAIVSSRDDNDLLLAGVYIALLGVLVLLVSTALAIPLSRLLKVPAGKRGMWIFCATFSNCGFIGFPVANAVFGEQGLFLAVFFNIAFNLVLFTVGAKTVSMDSGVKGGAGWKHIILNPVNLAILLGFVFLLINVAIPDPVLTTLTYLGETTTPLGMLMVGISISKGRLRDMFKDKDVVSVSLVRLIVMPLVMFFLLKLAPFPQGSLSPAIIVAMLAMPAPAVSLMFAERYQSSTEMAGQVVFLSSALSIVTMPLVFLFL